MITQSFLYNAIFFTYALVLTKIYKVPSNHTEYYFLGFAAGNFIGPLTIGRLFDTIGRRKMIAGTYFLSGGLLAISAFMFNAGDLTATTQTIWWCVVFFFASAGASAAYLTCSEIFPLEVRSKAIAVFFCIAQSFGALGPWLYGKLIGTGSDHFLLFIGYMIGAGVMMTGAVIEVVFGVAAEGRSLEDLAKPLSLVRKAAGSLPRPRRQVGPRSGSSPRSGEGAVAPGTAGMPPGAPA
jgi:MFS family permease